MIAAIRILKVSVFLVALLFGVSLMQKASATPIKTNVPMSQREQNARENCFDLGGRTFSVKYTYNANGSVASSTNKCIGGGADGTTCTNTATTIECTPRSIRRPGQSSANANLGNVSATADAGLTTATGRVQDPTAQVDDDRRP